MHNEDGSAYSGKIKGFLKQSVNALDKISTSKTGAALIAALSNSKNVFDIKHVSKGPSKQDEFIENDSKKAYAEQHKLNPVTMDAFNKKGIDITGGSGGTVYWDPNGVGLNTTSGVEVSSETDLAHEMAHGYDADRGLLNDTKIDGLRQKEHSVSYRENLIRGELNLPLRTSYGTYDDNRNAIQVPLINSQSQPIMPAGYKP